MSAYLLIAPGEVLNYSFDWTNELESGSPQDSIASSNWTVTPQSGSPDAPTLEDQEFTGAVSSVKVSEAAFGEVYRLTNVIVTTQGLTVERTIALRCGNR